MAATMSPMPRFPTHYAHRTIIGVNAFVLLCGIKAFQLLTMQHEPEAPKKPRTHWSVEETHLMLDLLIAQSSRIGQSATFPQSVYSEVARSLPSTNKTGTMVSSKFQTVRSFLFFGLYCLQMVLTAQTNLQSDRRIPS